MEPVRLPKVIASVMHADRVKRAKSRENSDGGAGFGHYLHQGRGRPAEGATAVPEEATPPPDAIDPEEAADAGGHTNRKLIDIRV